MPLPPEDAVVRAARREALIALGVWIVAMVYSVSYCYAYGYGRSVDTLSFVLWFPDWVFWGIIVPWLACSAFSVVFALGIMGGESLGEEIDAPRDEAGDRDEEVRHA